MKEVSQNGKLIKISKGSYLHLSNILQSDTGAYLEVHIKILAREGQNNGGKVIGHRVVDTGSIIASRVPNLGKRNWNEVQHRNSPAGEGYVVILYYTRLGARVEVWLSMVAQ